MPSKGNIAFMGVVIGLASSGVLATFMLALIHTLEGRWWYMVTFVVIWTLGGFALYPFIKQLIELHNTTD